MADPPGCLLDEIVDAVVVASVEECSERWCANVYFFFLTIPSGYSPGGLPQPFGQPARSLAGPGSPGGHGVPSAGPSVAAWILFADNPVEALPELAYSLQR